MNQRRISLYFLCLALAFVNAARGDGVIRDGIGARPTGRGGTNLAFEDNGEILLDNPAGMARVAGNGLMEAGIDILFTDLQYSDPQNPTVDAADNPFPMGQLSIIRHSADGLWSYGLGIFSVAGFSAEYDMAGPAPLGGPRHYKSIGAMGKILPGVACYLTDRLTVGATLGAAVSHTELEGPYFLQTPGLAGTPTILDLQATGASLAWSFGMQYELTDATTLGVSYQSETRFDAEGSAAVFVPGLGDSRYDAQLNTIWPQSVGVGLKHNLCPHRIVAVDVIWHDWSRAFDHFDLLLRNPTGAGFQNVDEQFPLDWRDSVSVRVGHEFRPDPNHVFRMGYAYHRNPIPDATLTPFIQATLEHAFSLGYGWAYDRAWDIDLAYQYSFGNDRNVGTSGLAGGDFSFSRSEAQVHWLLLSALKKF